MVVGPVVCPSLIGRERELEALVDCRLRSAKGRGGLVLVGGDVGIGKSRLIREFRGTLSGGRARFGIGYCREGGNAARGPLLEALAGIGCSVAPEPSGSMAEQLATIARALARSCSSRNAVLVLEDLQWADAGTLSFLTYVLPALSSQRLLIVATFRADATQQDHPAMPVVARLQRFASTILLEPLREREVRRLVKLAAGKGTLSAGELDRIAQRSDGNPFFAEELLKSVLDRRSSVGDLPLTVRAAVGERLARLDRETLEIARCATICGRQFSSALVAEILDIDRAAVLASLRRLRDVQIVEELGGDAFTFRHALTRSTIYSSMLVEEVRPVHRRALDLLERRGDASAYDLGTHAWAARDPDRALLYNERAGDEADALHAYADAIRCYERALEFARASDVRGRLCEKAAAVAGRDGHSRRAVEWYDAAIEAYRAAGEVHRSVSLCGAMAVQARLGGDTERAISILRTALGDVEAGDEPLRAELSLHLAFCALNRSDVETAQRLFERWHDAAPAPLRWSVACYAAAMRGDIDGLRALELPYREACAPLGPAAELLARFNVGYDLCTLGNYDEGLPILEAILPEIRRLRLPSWEVLTCANIALVHARCGELKEARDFVRRALGVPERLTTGPITLAAAALTVANLTGDDELVAAAFSDEVLESAFACSIDAALGAIAGPYARWLRRRGMESEARAVLRRAVTQLHGPFASTETILEAVESGDGESLDAARPLLLRLEELRAVPLYAATYAHVRALQASRAGDNREKLERAAEAQELYESLGWPVHAARCAEICDDRRPAAASRRHPAAGKLPRTAALSAREAQIAALVAGGASNKSLAERLRIGQRTIEKHLTSIYAKLGLRNRSELVALMIRRHHAESGG